MLPRSDPEGSHSLSEMSPRHMKNVKTSMVKESKEREVPGAQGERKSSQKSSPQEQVSLGQVKRRENSRELIRMEVYQLYSGEREGSFLRQ